MIVLPGGPGHTNLDADPAVDRAIRHCAEHGTYLAAICAAPFLLGRRGILKGRKGTCFPGYEKFCIGMEYTGEPVCVDGNIITAKGAGTSLEFGYKLAELLCGREKALSLAQSMQYAGTL
jgi:4-methyl-5(b-hydroxyethyl)-thiazole monophosphate biosynthesis